MSTRTNIGIYESKDKAIKDFDVLLYRHSDGYPDGVMPEIVPFLKWWKDQRGISDSEYTGARLLQYLCNQSDKAYKGATENAMGKNTDYTGIYGYGICKWFHGDIEYFYKIYPNAVEVYQVPFDSFPDWKDTDGEIDFTKWELIKTVEL